MKKHVCITIDFGDNIEIFQRWKEQIEKDLQSAPSDIEYEVNLCCDLT